MLRLPPKPGETLQVRKPDGDSFLVTVDQVHDGEAMVDTGQAFLIAPLHLDTKTGTYYCPESELRHAFTEEA
jgi:hypothetical protein